MITQIEQLRKEIHRFPELSGKEISTARRLKTFILKHHPTFLIEELGGSGFAAIYEFGKEGPTIVIRCELDALPIQESNNFDHKSQNISVSHKCGHDGHMAIVSGLIFWIKEQSFPRGKIILLFQPAEETGKGAAKVISDPRFKALNPEYIFALHNIPGEILHSIIYMEEGFSAEVQSFSITLTGKESHAAEPENGINPAVAISNIIQSLTTLNNINQVSNSFAVLTPVYLNLGQKAYGVSPANGEVHYTIRTWGSDQMNILKQNIENLVKDICEQHRLPMDIHWFEYFPASPNDAECLDLIKKAALTNKLQIVKRPYPFKFGEDFGWFAQQYKTGMFGLGSGIKTPALHNPDYDFPDEILETGINMFTAIIYSILAKN